MSTPGEGRPKPWLCEAKQAKDGIGAAALCACAHDASQRPRAVGIDMVRMLAAADRRGLMFLDGMSEAAI